MRYYSTNKSSDMVGLKEAVVKGLASDGGLFMPEKIQKLPDSFFEQIHGMSLQDIAFTVASNLFGEDIPNDVLRRIVDETFNFPIPIVEVEKNLYSMELFHGETMAFKDVGARFMSRMLSYFVDKEVNVLVATSGDTGSAVANGFLGVEGVKVFVLYPRDGVSEIQEKQFTTMGGNIVALAIDGTFDDCQSLVKEAFSDKELNQRINITSANSINVARFLPQSIYYFYAYAQLKSRSLVVSVPSGNLGNLTAGLVAKRMGLPIKRFIASNNSNDMFFNYLSSGEILSKPSVSTIANAMDVGDPSNFSRILDMYDGSLEMLLEDVSGLVSNDAEIASTIKEVYSKSGYMVDPHGACGYRALRLSLSDGESGVFLETAHPAKFKESIDSILQMDIDIPLKLQRFLSKEKQNIYLDKSYELFKMLLIDECK